MSKTERSNETTDDDGTKTGTNTEASRSDQERVGRARDKEGGRRPTLDTEHDCHMVSNVTLANAT